MAGELVAVPMIISGYLDLCDSVGGDYPNVLPVVFCNASYKTSFQFTVVVIYVVECIKSGVKHRKTFSSTYPNESSAVYIDVVLDGIFDSLCMFLIAPYAAYLLGSGIDNVHAITRSHIDGLFPIEVYRHDMGITQFGILG